MHHFGKQTDKSILRLRASEDSDDTQPAYRVAAFQTFRSGRISTFGDNPPRDHSTRAPRVWGHEAKLTMGEKGCLGFEQRCC